MSAIEARILHKQDFAQWDHFIRNSEQGTVFHLSEWMAITARMVHADSVIIGVFHNSDLIGGCTFFIKNIYHLYRRGRTNLPLTPYGGIVLSLPKTTSVRSSERREHEIISRILDRIETFNLFSLTLIHSPAITDIRPFIWKGWTERVYYAYMMMLDGDIFSHASHEVRKTIRKAQRNGITVTREYLPDTYWELIQSTFNKQNKEVPFEKDHLFALMEYLFYNNLGEMWIAKTPSGEIVSAAFNVYDRHIVHGWQGANDPRFRDTGATSLLLFELFMDLQRRGYRCCNLMAANTPHLAAFYSSFNPRLVPYYGVEKTHRTKYSLLDDVKDILPKK
jgi:hypothetical protein